jgi:nucleotide-binding universal stress UspA family protein
MATILCPTRGGEASYPTQDFAIQLAEERGADLIFLYVVDVRFLTKGSGAVVIDLEEELDEMGKFLLTMAQERAEKQGVEARRVVRRGGFQEALMEVIEGENVQTLVLGTPSTEDRLTTEEYLRDLAASLREEMEVEVVLVRDGQVIDGA